MGKVALGLVLCGIAAAQAPSLCINDRVGLNRFARNEFDGELRRLIADTGADLRMSVCEKPTIALALSAYPPERYSRALGLAYRSGNRVLPELRVYLHPVLKILGDRPSSAILGRALAQVAAHELSHYMRQQVDHDCQGLMRESFSGFQLSAQDRRRFAK